MHEIKWSDELSVDVDHIDDQHKELIAIANELIKAVSLGQKEEILDDILKRLREYTVFHFNSEEELMSQVRYKKRGDHALEHERLKRRVKEYQRTLYKKENLTTKAVLEFIKGWLLKHILTFDRDLARFIHENETSEMEVPTDRE